MCSADSRRHDGTHIEGHRNLWYERNCDTTNRRQTIHVTTPVIASQPSFAEPSVIEPSVIDEEKVDTTVDLDTPWIVLVWNDPINLMSYVTFVFQKLFGYSLEKETELMLDVHEKGRAVVSTGTRERAEIDVYRLHEHGLWATMQQDK